MSIYTTKTRTNKTYMGAPLSAHKPAPTISDQRPETLTQRKLQTAVQSSQPVLQAVWHFVQEINRQRKYNLTNNKDGTFTHTKTHVNYKDSGQKAQDGGPLLVPINALTPNVMPVPAQSFDPKNVLFSMNNDGKVVYLGNNETDRKNITSEHVEMDAGNFAIFKNGGKRSESNKVMDPVTLTRYYFDGKIFFNWNKDKISGKGDPVNQKPVSGQKHSEQEILEEKLKKGELVDRRREDRTSEDLSPFDVGPYKSNVTIPKESNPKLNRTFEKLSGIDAWTSKSSDTNRDHVPSGESLKQRGGGNEAYNTGFTIAIPNKLMHQPFSPTFGTDNSHKNGIDDVQANGKEIKRVEFDTENPATALYKDVSYMLDKTYDQDYSSSHSQLDLTQNKNRARQIGAYRHLYRRNTRMWKTKGKKYGVNPNAPGLNYTVGARKFKKKPKKATLREGAFTYINVKGETQGELISKMLRQNLLKKKLARRLTI